MTRLAVLALTTSLLLASADAASAETIYRWRDARGGWRFSNQPARAPVAATAVKLAPLGSITGPARSRPLVQRRGSSLARRAGSRTAVSTCGPADPAGLAEAVLSGLDAQAPADTLTLLVGGLAVSASRDANVASLRTAWDPEAPYSHLSQSAVAFPTGSSCPSSPPLVRYSTTRRDGASRGLCDDYRRAFAQIGVAANRDAGIARSFHDIAQMFVRVALDANLATASGFRAEIERGMFTSDAMQLAPYMTVPLSPWIVSAHVSQTENLAVESDALVEQLTVALEEIDRAARVNGCWD